MSDDAARPGEEIARELKRLPEVVDGRPITDEYGAIVGAYVVVSRRSMLDRVARDVQSVIEVLAGVEISFSQVLVVDEQQLSAGPTEAVDRPVRSRRWNQEPPESIAPESSRGDLPEMIEAAAARMQQAFSIGSPDDTADGDTVAAPAWGELITRPPIRRERLEPQAQDQDARGPVRGDPDAPPVAL